MTEACSGGTSNLIEHMVMECICMQDQTFDLERTRERGAPVQKCVYATNTPRL